MVIIISMSIESGHNQRKCASSKWNSMIKTSLRLGQLFWKVCKVNPTWYWGNLLPLLVWKSWIKSWPCPYLRLKSERNIELVRKVKTEIQPGHQNSLGHLLKYTPWDTSNHFYKMINKKDWTTFHINSRHNVLWRVYLC